MGDPTLAARLRGLGVDRQSAEGASEVASLLGEALELLGRDASGQVAEASTHWRERYSLKHQRLYYTNDRTGDSTWNAPPCFRFREWQLDASLYGLALPLAAVLYEALDVLLVGKGHPPERAYQALGVLCKLVGNVTDCRNTEERFRTVKLSNPKVQQSVVSVAGALDVLMLVGFRRQGDQLVLPADAPLGLLQAATACMRRLLEHKGHSGSAEAGDDAHGGRQERPPSEFYGRPGFRYQEQIWHCSVCNHPINDGSERLWTPNPEAPRGEYRYRCTTCEGAGATFDLCQACWEAFQAQEAGGQREGLLHSASHAFQHIGPRMSRHHDYYGKQGGGDEGAGDSSPWGRRGTGGGYSRGLQRLAERYGIRFA